MNISNRGMWFLLFAPLIIAIVVMVTILVNDPKYDNQDPRVGEVWVGNRTYLQCDGTTLVSYDQGGVPQVSIPNSTRCS